MEIEGVLAVIVAYLLGSIDFGVILPRLRGVDIYAVGSGNPGASNVLRTMGRGWAAAVLVGDIGKGTVAALIGTVWAGDSAGFAAMFGAAAGHCFPAFHGLRGGKGVAATGGALLWLEPWLGLGFIAGWAALVAVTKVASIASLVIIGLMIPALALVGNRGWSLVWAGATAALILGRHKGNIARMLRGQERTVSAA